MSAAFYDPFRSNPRPPTPPKAIAITVAGAPACHWLHARSARSFDGNLGAQCSLEGASSAHPSRKVPGSLRLHGRIRVNVGHRSHNFLFNCRPIPSDHTLTSETDAIFSFHRIVHPGHHSTSVARSHGDAHMCDASEVKWIARETHLLFNAKRSLRLANLVSRTLGSSNTARRRSRLKGRQMGTPSRPPSTRPSEAFSAISSSTT